MEINPYESPRSGEAVLEKALGDSDSVRQLLTEIRDAQFELLQLQREAFSRQRKFSRIGWLMIPLVMVVPLMSIYFTTTRGRPVMPPVPAKVLPRTLPTSS